MSMSAFACVTSALSGARPPVPEFRHQPSSIIMYSKPDARREVDVALDGRHVGAALVRRRQIGPGPPVPGGLARLDPRGVERRIRIQIADEIRFDEVTELVAQHDHAPRRTRAIRADRQLRAISERSSSRRDTRACTPGRPSPRPAEIQAAVVAQIRLADRERILRRAAHQRQVVVVVLADAARPDRIELTFVAGIDARHVEARGSRSRRRM